MENLATHGVNWKVKAQVNCINWNHNWKVGNEKLSFNQI